MPPFAEPARGGSDTQPLPYKSGDDDDPEYEEAVRYEIPVSAKNRRSSLC